MQQVRWQDATDNIPRSSAADLRRFVACNTCRTNTGADGTYIVG
jgi:hypothetical protein